MQKIGWILAGAALVAGCASHDEVPSPEELPVNSPPLVLADGTGPVDAADPARAARQFEMLKGLAGTWVASGAEGSVPEAQVRYEITSGGSAVVETIFPGEDHEMVSVYHMDNGRLVMTHYCAMGNQPFFTSTRGTAPDVIRFQCTGAGNTTTHADPHMHEGVFTIRDGTLHSEWTMYQDMERGGTVVIDLVRGDS